MRKERIDLKIDFLDDLPEVDVNFLQIQQCFIDRIITDHGGFLSFESLKGEFTKVLNDLPAKVNNECQDSCH